MVPGGSALQSGPMAVPLLDLKPQLAGIQADVMRAIERVVSSQLFILGSEVADLERELAARDGKDAPAIGEVVPLRNVRGPNPAGG